MSECASACYDGTLERTPDGGVIRFERHLRYPIGEVWDAITNPARLAEWWLPVEADITIDLQAGGQMVIAPCGEGAATITCTILRVEAPMLLEHTHLDGISYLRWELEPRNTGCVLRVAHFVTDIAGAIDKSYVAGLHVSLARLAPHLAGHPAAWDWEVFAQARAQYASVDRASPDADV